MEQPSKGLPTGPDRAATHSGRPLPDDLAAHDGSESKAKEKVKATASEASREAKKLMQAKAEQLRATANGIVDQAATDVGLQINETAKAVRDSLSPLREKQPKLASMADHSIDRLEQAAASVERQDLESVVAGASELARRRPELFIGGAALAGLALGRFIQLAIDQE